MEVERNGALAANPRRVEQKERVALGHPIALLLLYATVSTQRHAVPYVVVAARLVVE